MLRNLALLFLSLIFANCTSNLEVPEEIAAEQSLLPENLDYNYHIKPILSDRCFKCHGPDKTKIEAGLQLTSLDGASMKLESGMTAIEPGDIEESELVRRILSSDPEEVMPPSDSHLSLSAREKAMLITWIDQGAKYKEHWSLSKITKPSIPSSQKPWWSKLGFGDDEKKLSPEEEKAFVKNDIDRLTLAKMSEHNLHPSAEAPRATLLRRVSMDLTGLPPSPEEVTSFMNDKSSNAYEKVVDRLLHSPHFGEHLAVSWLDLARYADTHGYQDDGMRNVYPYRDWVITAFNENLSLDKFVTYQLAGDLLPEPSKEMLIATSFNRQHPQSQEGGIVPEEYMNEYVADRTNTFGKAFLGLTMECARCHDHKYDPISAKDYYSMSAFFNQNNDYGEVPYNGEAAPTLMLPDSIAQAKMKFIKEKITNASQTLDDKSTYENGFNNFLASLKDDNVDENILSQGLAVHLTFDAYEKDQYYNEAGKGVKALLSGDVDRHPVLVQGKFGGAIQLRGDCGVQLISMEDEAAKSEREKFYKGLNLERNQQFTVSFWLNVLKDKTSGPVITKNNGEFEGYRGYDIILNDDRSLSVRMMYVFPSNGIEFRTSERLPLKEWSHLSLSYDGSGRAEGLKLFINGKLSKSKLLADHLTKSILHGEGFSNWSFMPFEIGKNFRSTIQDIQVDDFRFFKRKLSAIEVDALSKNLSKVTIDGEREKLYEFYLWNVDPNFSVNWKALSALRLEETELLTDIPEVMIMQELPTDNKRKTFLLNRGAYDSPGEEVIAETPLRLGKLPDGFTRDRLGLANWLLHEDNSLFSRVTVNRIWMSFFGTGLVKTQEDFGNQGDLPSHPELLDWLAVTLREDQWNIKTFIKRIVMSATYRQSSNIIPGEYEKDPDNKWLSRGASYRYSAELVRDNALKASGLLVEKIGGPSVYPYQPSGIWEALAIRNAVSYNQGKGEDLYRRSMYTVWKRSSPPPMMLNFDASDRQQCTVRRQRTATPLQALVMMNDPQFIEAARVLAERTLKNWTTDDERITWIYLACISRPPRQTELKILRELLHQQRNHFRKSKSASVKLAKAGEFAVTSGLDPVEVAAYTVVANTVLNSDEALVKR
jgi:hypothetical protein